jgi:hypothetical protein
MAPSTRVVRCDNSCSYIIAFVIAALSAVRTLLVMQFDWSQGGT